jgi:hypothetical protein
MDRSHNQGTSWFADDEIGKDEMGKNAASMWAVRKLYITLITKLLSEEALCRWEDNWNEFQGNGMGISGGMF